MLSTLAMTSPLIYAAAAYGAVGGDWRIHTPFDEEMVRIFDTPDRTYFMGYARMYHAQTPGYDTKVHSIFMYDKEGDELRPLNSNNLLNGNLVLNASYNPVDRYLAVVYDDYDIDLIYDDGRRVNIPTYRSASLTSSKDVSDISFDPERHRIYMATAFGYIAIDDERGEIAESRNYGRPLTAVARMGDRLLLSADGTLYQAPADKPRLEMADYTPVDGVESVKFLLPLSETQCAYQTISAAKQTFGMLTLAADGSIGVRADLFKLIDDKYTPNRDGYLLPIPAHIYQLKRDGTWTRHNRDADDNSKITGSWDFVDFWMGDKRTGYWSRSVAGESGAETWTMTRQPFRPNAPAVLRSNHMAWHPRFGMLVNSQGHDANFTASAHPVLMLLSGLSGTEWTMYGLPYVAPEYSSAMYLPSGVAIDPDEYRYVYMGSVVNGLMRINLEDPSDVMHLSHTLDPGASLPGFVKVVESYQNPSDPRNFMTTHCPFSAPGFDRARTMWWTMQDSNDPSTPLSLWYWTSADRKASADAASCRVPGHFGLADVKGSTLANVWPLTSSANGNILVVAPNDFVTSLVLVDTSGTPGDTSDDTVARMNNLYDQDGTAFDAVRVMDVLEDTQTGYVWLATTNGVIYINPRTALSDPTRINRIKVARNDGTSLADYLLDGVTVNCIMQDSRGRKWFGTQGGGIVVTSSDGREVMMSVTSDNSMLPSDIVYAMVTNPLTGSVMVATDQGLAEFYPNGAGISGDSLDAVRAYPNPVRPDYYGWVTIDGLTDGAVVKIADNAGSVVCDLGRASGGSVQWDACGRNGERVASGVYYVLASSGPDDNAMGAVTKILVMK